MAHAPAANVLGGPLRSCCTDPVTGKHGQIMLHFVQLMRYQYQLNNVARAND